MLSFWGGFNNEKLNIKTSSVYLYKKMLNYLNVEKCCQICGLQQLQKLRLFTIVCDVTFFCSEIYDRTPSQNTVSFFSFSFAWLFLLIFFELFFQYFCQREHPILPGDKKVRFGITPTAAGDDGGDGEPPARGRGPPGGPPGARARAIPVLSVLVSCCSFAVKCRLLRRGSGICQNDMKFCQSSKFYQFDGLFKVYCFHKFF